MRQQSIYPLRERSCARTVDSRRSAAVHQQGTGPADRRPQLLHAGVPVWIEAAEGVLHHPPARRMPWTAGARNTYVGRGATGRVYEGTAELCDPQTGKTTQVRRITVKLVYAHARWRHGDSPAHEPAGRNQGAEDGGTLPSSLDAGAGVQRIDHPPALRVEHPGLPQSGACSPFAWPSAPTICWQPSKVRCAACMARR